MRVEIVFCSDAQIVLIPTLRGTTIHGNIVKHISLAHRQHKFHDDFQKVIMIVHLFHELLITPFMIFLINLWFFSKHHTWCLIALHFARRFLLFFHSATKSSLFTQIVGRRSFLKEKSSFGLEIKGCSTSDNDRAFIKTLFLSRRLWRFS